MEAAAGRARALLHEPRARALVYQAALAAVLIALFWYLYATTTANLARLGIRSGFDFFGRTANFPLAQALIDYDERSTYLRAFAAAILNTLLVAGLAMGTSLILGFLLGVARLSRNWPLSRAAGAVVEVNRNIPLLLHLLFWYYAVLGALPSVSGSLVWGDAFVLNLRGLTLPAPEAGPALWAVPAAFVLGLAGLWLRRRRPRASPLWPWALAFLGGLPLLAAVAAGFTVEWSLPRRQGLNYFGGVTLLPELLALWLGITVYHSAYIAEIVRGSVLSVAKVQHEAAAAIGLTPRRAMVLVIIPQALRVAVPPLGNNLLGVIKDTALGAAIGYPEIMQVFQGAVLFQTGQAVEVTAVTLVTYLAISLLVAGAIALYNRRLMARGRG